MGYSGVLLGYPCRRRIHQGILRYFGRHAGPAIDGSTDKRGEVCPSQIPGTSQPELGSALGGPTRRRRPPRRPSSPGTPTEPPLSARHQADWPAFGGDALLISSSSMRVSGSAMPALKAWLDSSS